MLRWIAVLFACFVAAGCAAMYSAERPAQYYEGIQGVVAGPSLFASDAEVLSDADIARILEHEYTRPGLARIALLPFGWSAFSGWSEQLAISTAEVNERVLATLRASPKVYDASFLPAILIPEKRTVPYLREAAARYQTDLLLVFRSECGTFERERLLRPDQSRSYCFVEAVLLDVRTGLVPFVAAATQSYDGARSESDLNLRETMLRSQLAALAAALGEVSTAVVHFLDANEASASVPASGAPGAGPTAGLRAK